MSEFPEHEGAGRRTSRQTGAVGLIISGERPTPRTGPEILEIARETEFVEEGRIEREYEGGSIEFTPRAMLSNPIATALVEGLLILRVTITGAPPKAYQLLDLGTYYLYVDFIEGPDDDEGRWVGRMVGGDGGGGTPCLVPGIIFKQRITFSMDAREHEEHSRVRVHMHGFGVGETARLFGEDDGWIVTPVSWEPVGTDSCWHDIVCSPPV
jgi:hypothetical protein